MPKSLAKVHKKISKKRGNTTSLNENSRDAQRLRRAGARDDKLAKLSAARAKVNQPHSTLWENFVPRHVVFLLIRYSTKGSFLPASDKRDSNSSTLTGRSGFDPEVLSAPLVPMRVTI